MAKALSIQLGLSEHQLKIIFEELFRKSSNMFEVVYLFNKRFNSTYNGHTIKRYFRTFYSRNERLEIARKMRYNIDGEANKSYVEWFKSAMEKNKKNGYPTYEFEEAIKKYKPYDML
jgi:hypothetical protein